MIHEGRSKEARHERDVTQLERRDPQPRERAGTRRELKDDERVRKELKKSPARQKKEPVQTEQREERDSRSERTRRR
jgi:hypothetical protein